MIQDKLNLPYASSINYRNADEVCGYQLLLCKIYEREGGLNYPPTSNILTATIKREGMVWLKKVRNSIAELFASSITVEDTGLKLEEIPRVLKAYDFFYRICNGSACHDFIRDVVLKSANRYVNGDRSLSQAQIALMLLKEMERDIPTMDERYLTFSGKVMESWVDALELTGKIEQVSESDSYDILNFLLVRDLFAFGIKRDSKLKWIKSYALSNEMLDLLDTKTFWQYIGFNQAAEFVTGKSLEEQDDRYVYLSSRLAEREDIHPFIREAIEIDIAKFERA